MSMIDVRQFAATYARKLEHTGARVDEVDAQGTVGGVARGTRQRSGFGYGGLPGV